MNDGDYCGRNIGRSVYRSAQRMALEHPTMPPEEIADRVMAWTLRSLAANCARSFGDEKAREMFIKCFDQGVMMLEEFDLQPITFRSPPKP